MIKWGISAGTHDASLTVVEDDKILFASHSERYSRIKNDAHLNDKLVADALSYGEPEKVYWYENPILKAGRKLYAGQDEIWLNPKSYLKKYGINTKVKWSLHHESHAAAGYYTSPFDSSAILVIDAIGEFDTTSIWLGKTGLQKLYSRKYPTSLGLFYSAITDRVGLKPNEDEYILMGMAAYGRPRWCVEMRLMLHNGYNFHRGCREAFEGARDEDLACSAQIVYEEELEKLLVLTKQLTNQDNLVLMGGCALNCLANRFINKYFNHVWIMPNPGDAGSSLGAIAAGEQRRLNWKTPYLGYNIEGRYPVEQLLDSLLTENIVGVANGRAEFGPRALGNRSLLADIQIRHIKDTVNEIKQRQKFRPFAPVILKHEAHRYFDVPRGFESPYMQYVVRCKEPHKYPAIVHHDGTSRVQTVTKEQHPGLFRLLMRYKKETGTPMLLNTSLNIKGEPMVNDKNDAQNFYKKYGVKVFS
jgi:carbamoyltransferase